MVHQVKQYFSGNKSEKEYPKLFQKIFVNIYKRILVSKCVGKGGEGPKMVYLNNERSFTRKLWKLNEDELNKY